VVAAMATSSSRQAALQQQPMAYGRSRSPNGASLAQSRVHYCCGAGFQGCAAWSCLLLGPVGCSCILCCHPAFVYQLISLPAIASRALLCALVAKLV
jgi:hypothetical protein